MKYNLNFPEQTAIIFGDRKYSYREFDDITDKIAVSLIQLRIHQSDRIALHLANCPEIVFCYYACFKIGAIAVPINARLKAPEIEYILGHCQAKICISQEDLFPEIQSIQDNLATCQTYFLVGNNAEFADVNQFSELLNPKIDKTELPRIDPNAVAAILYTSGM
ncbi:MAG: AMP-binding protein [Cyanobacteria bacterium J06638_38]